MIKYHVRSQYKNKKEITERTTKAKVDWVKKDFKLVRIRDIIEDNCNKSGDVPTSSTS